MEEKCDLFKNELVEKMVESCHKTHLNNWTWEGVFGKVGGERKKQKRERKKKEQKEWKGGS